MKKQYVVALIVAALLCLGFLVPLGSYTTRKGCPVEPTPTKRLHLILGDTLNEVKQNDIEAPANVGCSANTKYVLYLF